MLHTAILFRGTVSLAALVIASQALAHDQATQDEAVVPAAAGEEAQSGGLEDIVVTARRQSERLQDAPVAVTAITADRIEKLNIQDVTAVPQITPNLTIAQQSTSITAASIYIRGIGNQEPSSVSEQGVGVYLDGVYIARSAGAIFDLVDLERIEVLRGPQGTLFGRNTVGGAIQLVSRKPQRDFHANVKAGYGTDNEWYVKGRVDTGQFGPFSASLAYLHKERDGYVDNLLVPSSKDPGALNGDALFFGLRGDFGKFTVDYSFDYDNRQGTAPYFQVMAASPDTINYFGQSPNFGGDPFLYGPKRRDSGLQAGYVDGSGELRWDARAKIQGHSLTLQYDATPGLTLKSITGYRKFFQDTILALSGNGNLLGVVLDPVTFAPSIAPVTLYNGNNAPQRQDQFSQEFQALGRAGDFNYVLGVYYFEEDAGETNNQALTFVLPGGQAGLNLVPVQAFDGTAKSYAGFGQVSWKPGSLDGRLEVTGGLRYTSDKKTILLRGDVVPNLAGKVSFENFSWLGSVNYKFTPDVMAYIRVSSGYRSGGINPRTNVINVFDPEKAISYEAGLKSELFNNRVRANLAVFQTDYQDLQVQQFASGTGGATSLIVNAGKVVYRGFEAEVTVAPVKGLTFEGSVGYTDPDYKTFLFRDPLTNQVINVADEARMPQTAKFNLHAGAEYITPIGIGNLSARVDYSYRSTIWWFALDRVNPFNADIRSRPDHNLRARLSLADVEIGRATAEFGIWGNNLTNQENIDFGVDFGGLGFGAASFKRPRTIGIDAKFSY